jgi:hypothetical protein
MMVSDGVGLAWLGLDQPLQGLLGACLPSSETAPFNTNRF